MNRGSLFLIAALSIASLLIAFFATCFGTISINQMEAWRQWLSLPTSEWDQQTRILALRLPRIVLAWLAGGALATAGAVMQTLLRNSLATPFTLGIASAGSFGAFLVLAMPGLAIFGSMSSPLYSLLASLLCLLLVLKISNRSNRADGLLLAGITLNFLFGAGVMLVRYLADPFQLASMERWMLGSVNAVNINTATAPLPWIAIGLAFILPRISALDQLAFDEEIAAARGVPVKRYKTQLLLASGLLTAGVVAYTGPIGFVGLLVPHAVRWFTGLRHGALIPACFFSGGIFMILADLVARTTEIAGRNSELPIGIVTAIVGGPFFLLLLIRKN
jgi:iron complex transport system permease protein